MKGRRSGSALIEAVVASAILAATLGAFLLSLQLHLLQPQRMEGGYRMASALASALARIGGDIELKPGFASLASKDFQIAIEINEVERKRDLILYKIQAEARSSAVGGPTPITLTTYRLGR